MRLARRLALLAIVAAAALLAGYIVDTRFSGVDTSAQAGSAGEAVRVYLVPTDAAVDFNVAPPRSRVKLVVNAMFEDIVPGSDLGAAYYSVHYQVLDGARSVLEEDTYHHRVQIGWRTDPVLGTATSRRRLAARNELTPSDTNLMYIDLSRLPGSRTLRITAGPSSRPIAMIAVRPYIDEPRDDDPERRWLRLHKTTRTEIAKANVFDVELLTSVERANLLRRRWRPPMPDGIEGEDYQTDLLYDVAEEGLVTEADADPADADGLIAQPGHAVTLPVLERSNSLLLDVSPLRADAAVADTVEVRWYGRTSRDFLEARPSATAHGAHLALSVPRGLLEVVAAEPVRVRVVDALRQAAVEPRRFVVPLYTLVGDPVVFAIAHASADATPVRLDVRSMAVSQAGSVRHARYVAADRLGRTRLEGRLDVATARSLYDILPTNGGDQPVSDPAQHFLLLPADIETLRVDGDDGLLVTAYNRPPSLIRSVEIPESLFGGGAASELRPAWFILPAQQDAEMRAAGRVVFAETQVRPPDLRETAEQDVYNTERLLPVGPATGRVLLEPKIDSRPVRDVARSTTFLALHPNESVSCRLAGTRRDDRVMANLIFDQADPDAQSVAMSVDEQPFATLPIRGRSGRVALPPLPRGIARIAFQARAGTELFLSHADLVSGSADRLFREQLAYPLTRELAFEFDRRHVQNESLSVRLYGEAAGRAVVELNLEPLRRSPGAQPAWSFERARYDVLLEELEPAPRALDAGHARVDHVGYFFHRLALDVPAGVYRVSLRQLDGPPVLTGVSRFTAGEIDASEVTVRSRPDES